jgi:hypothetical protein
MRNPLRLLKLNKFLLSRNFELSLTLASTVNGFFLLTLCWFEYHLSLLAWGVYFLCYAGWKIRGFYKTSS